MKTMAAIERRMLIEKKVNLHLGRASLTITEAFSEGGHTFMARKKFVIRIRSANFKNQKLTNLSVAKAMARPDEKCVVHPMDGQQLNIERFGSFFVMENLQPFLVTWYSQIKSQIGSNE